MLTFWRIARSERQRIFPSFVPGSACLDEPQPQTDSFVCGQQELAFGMSDTQPTTSLPTISPAAKRMRRHRERRRNKLRCFRIELRETEIDWLVRIGFLDHGSRFDKVSVLKAFYIFLDRTLGA